MTKFSKTKTIFLIILSFGIFGLAKVSQAATLYVCPSGCQYSTIQAAANVVNPGDTVIVRDGTYAGGSYIVNLKRGGTSSSWITFRAENKWGAKIDGRNTSDDGFFLSTGAHYIRIEDFEIYGTRSGGVTLDADSQVTPPPTVWAHHIYVKGCKIHDIARVHDNTMYGNDAIGADYPCTDLTIDSCILYNIGRLNYYTSPQAVPLGTKSANEATCTGEDGNSCYNHDHGIYFRGAGNLTVQNSIFYSDFKSGWAIVGFGKYGSATNNKIINNTFYVNNPEREGITTNGSGSSPSELIISNNIIHSPNGWCISHKGSNLSQVQVKNNICYNSPALAESGACSQPGWTCTGNIMGEDPKFVNLSARDFHLQSTSPAINKGISTNAPSKDFDGNSRPQGSGFDIGAYEYEGIPPDTTSPAAPQGLTVK
jgi:hypothetical protein